MFWTRLFSGIVLVAIALVSVILGGTVLFGVIAAISLIGMFELYRVYQIQRSPAGFAGYLGAAGYFALLYFGGEAYSLAVLAGAFLLIMAVYVFSFPKIQAEQAMASFFGIFYLAVMLSYVYLLREGTDGTYLVWLVFFSSWGCDTCAYCAGRLFGKHKMAPVLSPKKSVEGAVGGVLGAGILGGVYGAIFAAQMPAFGDLAALWCALICMAAALLSMVGDLAASAIKRNHGIKDYGKLIPGHGGILDRFDSMIFTAPVIFYLAQFLQG